MILNYSVTHKNYKNFALFQYNCEYSFLNKNRGYWAEKLHSINVSILFDCKIQQKTENTQKGDMSNVYHPQ